MFTIYKTTIPEEIVPVILTVAQKKELVDLFASTRDTKAFIRQCILLGIHYEEKAVIDLFNDLTAIDKYINDIMRGQVLITPAIDEKEAIYNKIPTTLTALKAQVLEKFPVYGATGISYVVDMAIKWANGIGDCTLLEFVSYFK